MTYTGGELNLLNGKYGISAPANSVPVMRLIKVHRPKSRNELYELIKRHYEIDCPCGIKSKGYIEDFGQRLYEVQKREWGQYRYSLRECIQWEYDLFVVQSLKGNKIENAAKKKLSDILKTVGLSVQLAEGFVDEELRVDLLIEKNGNPICGVQVKPSTYNKMRKGVVFQNEKANEKWGKPVLYLFYNDKERLQNIDKIITSILSLL